MILILLNQREKNVFFVKIGDDVVCDLSDRYGNDVESWVSELGLEKRLHFQMSDCSYMLTDEMPEMYGYDSDTQQEMSLSLIQ